MTDIFTKEKRSEIMSKIKNKWTKPERKMHSMLKGVKIKHKMHPKVKGNPDIIIKDNDLAIFIHGCFWHRCAKCYKKPTSNESYWTRKIKNNVKRDKKNIRMLKSNGWKVMCLWEHDVMNKEFKNFFYRNVYPNIKNH